MSVNVSRSRVLAGILLVAAGAVAYGLLPVPLEILRAEDVGSGSSLLVRYGVSIAVLGAWVAWRRPARRDSGAAFLAGLGLGSGTIFLFEGYARLPSSTAILVFYTYPAFTLVLARLLLGTPVERRMVLAIVSVLVAAGLILSPGNLGETSPIPVLITFGAPLGYGLYLAFLGKASSGADTGWRTFVVSIAACLVTVAWHAASESGVAWPASQDGWLSLAFVGFGTGVVATCLVVAGTSMAGSSRSAVAGSSELVTVLLVGWLVFGEAVRAEALVGAVLILAAILVSLPRPPRGSRRSSRTPP